MEHHLLPKNAWPVASSELQVPCHCDPPFYQGKRGDFLTYPSTRDRSWLAVTDRVRYRNQVFHHVWHHQQSTRELEAFFQEWLFFGFLKEALGDNFDPASLTRIESGVRFIDTSTLPSLLDQEFQQYTESFEHFETFRTQISSNLTILVCLVKLAAKSPYINPSFDQNIIFSITTSAHLVVHALSHAFACRHGYSDKSAALVQPEALEYPNDAIKKRMIEAGWCPSELHVLNRKFRSLQTLFVLNRMNRKFLGRDHTGCTTDLCKHYQNKSDACLPKHTSNSCPCAHYDDKQLNADVCAILLGDKGTIPVLDIRGDKESLKVNVIEATADTPYVAYSHVWRDGLGNSEANALPCCQLCRLQALAQMLKTQEEPRLSGSKHYIWVDTICCPNVSPNLPQSAEAKRVAINLMRQTYERAVGVLVLDASLQNLHLNGLPTWETLLWIFTSNWSSRLWCLQEGVLPARLWFQFDDQSVSSETLRLSLIDEAKQDSRARDIALDLADEIHWLDQKRSPTIQYTGFGTVTKDFIALISGLQGRAVSVASDEALCIAAILDLSIDDLQNVPEKVEDRMCKLWELVDEKYQGIPIGLLAGQYPRLGRSGYRWAPRSLLQSQETSWLHRFAYPKQGRLVKNRLQEQVDGVDNRNKFLGLSFCTSGFVIRKRQWNDGLLHNNPWQQLGCRSKAFSCSTFEETSTGQFHWFHGHPDAHGKTAGDDGLGSGYNYLDTDPCAVLQMAESSPEGTCSALFGKLKLLPDGTRLITDPLHVNLAKRTPTENIFFSAAQAIARKARGTPCAAALDQFQAEGDHAMEQPAFDEAKQSLLDFLLLEANNRLEDTALRHAMEFHFGVDHDSPATTLRIMACDWFFNDYEGTYHGPDTEWIVD